jgi:hypothetical protein
MEFSGWNALQGLKCSTRVAAIAGLKQIFEGYSSPAEPLLLKSPAPRVFGLAGKPDVPKVVLLAADSLLLTPLTKDRKVVNLQREIDEVFERKAFERPLFYSYPGGLRFSLSEKGTAIEQFLLALQKARCICEDIFSKEGSLVVCLRVRSGANPFAHRPVLAELRAAGIKIPSNHSRWLNPIHPDNWFNEHEEEHWANVAFHAPLSLLQNFLWCALAKDIGDIRPRPFCDIYFFNLNLQVMAFPYDDRGMDVVGPNRTALAQLYQKHQRFLLTHDRPVMDEVFGVQEPHCR